MYNNMDSHSCAYTSRYLQLALDRQHSIGQMVHSLLLLHRPRVSRTGKIHYHLVHEQPRRWRPVALEWLAAQQGNASLTVHRLNRSVDRAASRMPPNDVRWLAYAEAMRAARIPSSACVFAIDLGDVGVLRDPTPLCDSGALVVSTDSCRTRGVKPWLADMARRANYPLSAGFAAFLSNYSAPLLNCGLVGGSRRIFDPFLEQMSSAIVRHHRRHLLSSSTSASSSAPPLLTRQSTTEFGGAPHTVPVDMVVLNDLVAHYTASPIVRGFPAGPVNLPFWGDLCGSNCSSSSRAAAARIAAATRSAVGSGGEEPERLSECKLREIEAMVPSYYFSHKVQFPWNRIYPPSTSTSSGGGAGRVRPAGSRSSGPAPFRRELTAQEYAQLLLRRRGRPGSHLH